MAIYKVWSGATGAASGADWDNAFLTLAAGFSAATSAWDVLEVARDHIDLLTATPTYAMQKPIAVVVVNRMTGAFAQMDGTTGYIGSADSHGVSFTGGNSLFAHGLYFKSAGGSSAYFGFGNTYGSDGFNAIISACTFRYNAAQFTGIVVGYNSGVLNCQVSFVDCTIRSGSTSQALIRLYASAKFENLTIDPAGSLPAALVDSGQYAADVEFSGCDLSHVSTVLVSTQPSKKIVVDFTNCALHADVTPLATQTPSNLSSGEVSLYNCSKGGVSGFFGHYNALGSTEMTTSVYANDGKTYDGANRCAWKITSTAYASFYAPYMSPWFNRAFIPAATPAAITPYVECLREGLALAYTNGEVWPEWSYQGTADSAHGTLVSGKRAYEATATNLPASSKTAADWTGETGTAWCGKLGPSASITPIEPGYLRARVCIGAPSATVYVDPQCRGVA